MTIEAARELRRRIEASAAAAQVTVAPLIAAESLSDEQVAAVTAAFPAWSGDGVKVAPGDVLAWDGTLVEVIQGHTTQADWTPDKVPALFKVHRTPEMTEWVAGIDVKAGEKLTYKGATYEVVQSHRTQAGWEPDRVPSLWKKI